MRELHVKYDVLMKEFKSVKKILEDVIVIEGMTNEHQSEQKRMIHLWIKLEISNVTIEKQTIKTKTNSVIMM